MYDYEMTKPVCFWEKDAIDIVQNCNAVKGTECVKMAGYSIKFQ